jgi:hypothetical protein
MKNKINCNIYFSHFKFRFLVIYQWNIFLLTTEDTENTEKSDFVILDFKFK